MLPLAVHKLPWALPNLSRGRVPRGVSGKQCLALMCLKWMHDGNKPSHLSPSSGLKTPDLIIS